MRIIDLFDRGVSQGRDKACLIDLTTGDQRTYGEAWQASHQIANGLLAAGVVPEETKVAVYSYNAARAVECVLGVLRSGAVWTPINVRNSVADNAYILNSLDVEILCYHSEFFDQLPQLRELCPKIRHFVCINGKGEADSVSVDDWIGQTFTLAPELAERRHAPMAIFGSGGTTGKPKGVVHSHATWECLTVNLLTSMPSRRPPVHLVVAPMTHAAAAMAFPLFAIGVTQVLVKKMEAPVVLEAISRYQVTHIFLPPTALYMLLADPNVRKHDYSSLEYFAYGAAPASVEKIKEAIDVFGPVMTQVYGQSEAGPLVGTVLSPAEHMRALKEKPEQMASCGRPTLLTKLKIVDDEGGELPQGQTGNIAIGGDFQMLEYYKNPEQTAAVRRNGWIETGDVGRIDDEGYVYIVDRKREMIITGGFNVYPSEIEQAIFHHPAVQDCAVVGVPDEKWGEAVKAVVQLKPGATATEAEIIALCRERLGGVMTPKSVEFWDDLPRSPVGKVLRRSVREKFWEGRSRRLV